MSEYQYYEFLAMDRPLSAQEMAELRALSTRARITAVSFVNEYSWGSFKGDPDTLMERYFDAHVYLANWGQRRFSLRLPRDVLDFKMAAAYGTEYALVIREAGEHWVIDWNLSAEDEGGGWLSEDEGHGWMVRLTPLREELLRGDWRGLYIGWLAGVTAEEVEDDQLEPPVPAGLKQFTPAQLALATFLAVDFDVLTAAAMASADAAVDATVPEDMETWLDTVSPDEARDVLRRLLVGQGQQTERSLKARFVAWQRAQRPPGTATANRRTVAELLRLAEEVEQIRQRQEAQERARADAEHRKQREVYLGTLARDFDRAWAAADQQAARGVASAYDDVRSAVTDLAEAYERYATREQFEQALRRFMAPHVRRTTLVKRLIDAGLWKRR
jgi:hypothetical protein